MKVSNSVEQAPDWNSCDSDIRKIVLGPSPGESGAKPLRLAALPADLAARFPQLTHLYLWQCAGLRELPALPAGLECLDVRGCADLEQLPSLPATLETLDLGGCAKLQRLPAAPTGLRRFYFNGCAALKAHSLAGFLEALEAVPVEELDGSETSAVTSLEEFPKSALRKLVLKGCPKLADVSALASFPALEHVNLGGCTALATLPDLPPRLRFLVLHGAEKLRVFMGQDIGPYDRGAENQDVAKAFQSRKKFGHELAIMPHAKLLLMGDGRVGKTTLAKRLQWEELDAEDRSNPANKDLQPSYAQVFTHGVQFWRWETGLRLAEKESAALDERAASAHVELPKTAAGDLAGAVRVWDFGGQEVYHLTHRIFAGEGSIFLLVWREQKPAAGAAPGEKSVEEWEEWNRQRPLDYWLDYIYSMRPQAKVALVCTNCPNPDQMAHKPDWRDKAPKHRQLDLPSFFVDSLDVNCGRHSEYQRLVRWVREACGAEAQRIGILQPRFYRQVSDLLDGWLSENSLARQNFRKAEHLLCPWPQWQESVVAAHRDGGNHAGPSLDDNDVAAITDYLHQAGHLFQIRHQAHRAILVDQQWAGGLIYRLLACEGRLRGIVKDNGGWFYRADLESDAVWKDDLHDDVQRERLLAYMEECRVVTRIAEAENRRVGQDIFLASDKWLLPEYKDQVERKVEWLMQLVREAPGMVVREKFEFEELTLSEFDFRILQAQLARTFGTRAIYFRNGFQAQENDNAPDWCFRLRWLPNEKDPFAGKIDAVLVARRRELDWLSGEIEDLFYAEGSPIARDRRIVRTEVQPRDLSHEYFPKVRLDKYDVALSSSGADKAEAKALYDAMKASGFEVNWYQIPDCRANERQGVMNFMKSLGEARSIVLLLSEGYLRNDAEVNWYCAWELADAIRQLGGGKHTAEQTLVVFKESDGFRFAKVNEIAFDFLKEMATHFQRAYAAIDPRELENFEHYHDFTLHFAAAMKPENWRKFAEARGAHGSAINYGALTAAATGGKDFTALIREVEKATGKKAIT